MNAKPMSLCSRAGEPSSEAESSTHPTQPSSCTRRFVENAEPSIWLGVEEEGAPDTVLPAAIPDPATDPFHFQRWRISTVTFAEQRFDGRSSFTNLQAPTATTSSISAATRHAALRARHSTRQPGIRPTLTARAPIGLDPKRRLPRAPERSRRWRSNPKRPSRRLEQQDAGNDR